jgi:uncharacterized membrane protein
MKKRKPNLFQTISGVKKLIFSIALSLVLYLVLLFLKIDISSRIILAWDTFCLSMIGLSWILFFTTTSDELCNVVEKQDDGIKVIFFIVLIAVCFGVFGTLILILDHSGAGEKKIIHTLISLSPVLFSWILLHTIFTIRYAHLYHGNRSDKTKGIIGGLEFPVETEPDYLDFAYFSFVIGMTFQVSDITISSKTIRRFVLLHSLISFVFNTILVALTINAIAGLNK